MGTRAERKAANKAAHAIRRQLTNEDYRQAKADGLAIAWRDVAAQYDGMPAADILASFGDVPAVVPVPAVPRAKRAAPAHVTAAKESFDLARFAWEAGLAEAMRGARANGKPARGEKYTDEERDYRDAHKAPVFKEFLAATYAAMRADREAVTA